MNLRRSIPHGEGTQPAFNNHGEVPTRAMPPVLSPLASNEAHHSSAEGLLERFRRANRQWVEAELERVPLEIAPGEHQQLVVPHVPSRDEQMQLRTIEALGDALAFRRECDDQAQARVR